MPYLEVESAYTQNLQGLSQMKCGRALNLSNTHMEMHRACAKLDKESVMVDSENAGLSYYLVSLFSFFGLFFKYFYLYNGY